MSTFALVGLLTLGGTTAAEAGTVSKADTLSIHIRDVAASNSVFTFLSEELDLPVIYGLLWTPDEEGTKKRYSGIWAGNVCLEPCGPFPDAMYKHTDFKAMFYGLTFDPCESVFSSLAELDKRGIGHVDQLPAYAYVHGEMSEKGMGVSIREYQDPSQAKKQRDRVRAEMKASGGGPLGIQDLKEIHIGYSDDAHLQAWNNFPRTK